MRDPCRAAAPSVPSHPVLPDETPAAVRPSFRAPIPTPIPALTPKEREGDISPVGNSLGTTAATRSEEILADSWAQAMLLLHTDDLEQARAFDPAIGAHNIAYGHPLSACSFCPSASEVSVRQSRSGKFDSSCLIQFHGMR
jgi:hypothetical protein